MGAVVHFDVIIVTAAFQPAETERTVWLHFQPGFDIGGQRYYTSKPETPTKLIIERNRLSFFTGVQLLYNITQVTGVNIVITMFKGYTPFILI